MRYYPEVKKAIGASEKIFEYLDRKPKVRPEGTLAPENLKGHIQFKNVRFSYAVQNGTEVLKVCIYVYSMPCVFIVLKSRILIAHASQTIKHIPLVHQGVTLEVKPHQITALVGLNRSGKSTCVKLLERFYQPQAGEILLDGKPLQSYKDQYLHDNVGSHKTFFAL